MEQVDVSLVDWSRAQFALTAIYHWIFVPLTLGLSFIIAIMETVYVKTGDEEWKRMTKFWMSLFGVNFAIGVATGIILEFEFGTNWSNYSWIVGDIFGAPLAIEGIMAFFLESTFIAVMFFGWNKVSKRFHLMSSWLVAVGSNLSALWILVANGWMQNPVGMAFNPDTARNEMVDFWAVLMNPMAVNKFLHTVLSSYLVASLFVVGVSSWFLIRKRERSLALKSVLVASLFGMFAALSTGVTGDMSSKAVAEHQPMKLAAMEGLYEGGIGAELVVLGVMNPGKKLDNDQDPFLLKLAIPKALSVLAYGNLDAYVPGVNDLIRGNAEHGILSFEEKHDKGKRAVAALRSYKVAKKENDEQRLANAMESLRENYAYIGYGYMDKPVDVVPNVPLVFYSFHAMVGLGVYFIVMFSVVLLYWYKRKLESARWLQYVVLFSFPLGYVASELGWVVAEVGRQPWTIQDILPTSYATSHLDVGAVQTTFFMFVALFTLLLIADVGIMIKTIKKGPEGGEHV